MMISRNTPFSYLDTTNSLSQRLREGASLVTDPIPTVLLRKYLAYVRQAVNPRLSEEAAALLKEFYLTLREKYANDDSIPITLRQFESLIRLSQAKAKLERRDIVSIEDARDIVDLMKESLFEVLADDMGCVDFERSTGSSKNKVIKKLVSLLNREAERKSSAFFSIAVWNE